MVAVVTDRQALDPRCEIDGQMRATLPDDPPSQASEVSLLGKASFFSLSLEVFKVFST